MLHHYWSVSDEVFWSAVSLGLPGPETTLDTIHLARETYQDSWEGIQRGFVMRASLIADLDDWGCLGLDVEAAMRVRLMMQVADEYALNPDLHWPPKMGGWAQTPHDLLNLGHVIADHVGLSVKRPPYIILDPREWMRAFVSLLGLEGGSPTQATLDDDRARRQVVVALDKAVEIWATNGTRIDPGPQLWAALDDDDGVEAFVDSAGRSVLALGDHIEAQLKGAVHEARQVGARDTVDRAQWLAALRLALRGELAIEAARRFEPLRPWSHDELVQRAGQFLS